MGVATDATMFEEIGDGLEIAGCDVLGVRVHELLDRCNIGIAR